MFGRRPNGWKVDREVALRRERERNAAILPEFDEKLAEQRLREGMERLRRSLEKDRRDNPPPF